MFRTPQRYLPILLFAIITIRVPPVWSQGTGTVSIQTVTVTGVSTGSQTGTGTGTGTPPSGTDTSSTTSGVVSDPDGVGLMPSPGVGFDTSGTSLSDLAIDEVLGVEGGNVRSPFSQGQIDEQFDPQSLDIQGIIVGPDTKMALVSSQVVSVGSRLGTYNVKDIKPGKVVLSQLDSEYDVRMSNYSPHLIPREAKKYFVEFHNANLKQALNMLAKASSTNIIVPDDTDGKITTSFNNIDVANAIGSVLHVNKLEYAVEDDIMRVGPSEQFKDGSDLKALSIPLNYATADELETKVKAFLSDRGKTISDKRTNTVIVKDLANVIDSVKNFLEAIDKRDPQVSIEAKIIDATTTFSRSLGIQWGFATGPNNATVRGNQGTGSITGSPVTGTVSNFGANNPTSGLDILIGRLPGNSTLQTTLSAAEAQGLIRIISKPNVTTLNNKQAKMRSGDTIYVKVNAAQGGNPELKEIETGITLNVTPQITLNRIIKMNIEAAESAPDFSRLTDGVPAIIENTATTTVLVPDGETAIIAGLLRTNSTKDKRQVPAISKVPILGWLFKGTSKTKEHEELMIFITPKILDSTYYSLSDDKGAKLEADADIVNTKKEGVARTH